MSRLNLFLLAIATVLLPPGAIAQQKFTKDKSFHSPLGRRTRIVLPDHSIATLNSNSSLWLDKKFNIADRTVSMSGDVLFEIKPGKKPFRIYTPHLVLTTTTAAVARVNGYAGSAGEETLLFSGSLHAVKAYYSALDHEPYDLKNGEMVMMNKDIDLMEKETFSVQEERAWIEDKLVLKDCTPPQLVKKLSGWFNVEITFATSYPAHLQYTGSFQGASLDAILTAVAQKWNFRFSMRDNSATIRF